MFDKMFGGDVIVASTRALDAYALRHQAISNNLANVNTPGYKRQVVNFEDQLAGALAAGRSAAPGTPSSISLLKPTLATVGNTSERADGNNVNVEIENSEISANTLRYETMAQQVTGYFKGLQSVINGR